jgi:hypothetical protein
MFGSVCKVRVVTLMQRATTEEYKILRRDIKSEQGASADHLYLLPALRPTTHTTYIKVKEIETPW